MAPGAAPPKAGPIGIGRFAARVLAIALLVVAAGASGAALVLLALSGAVVLPEVHGLRGAVALFALTCGAIGCAIAFRQPRNAVAWIFLVSGACGGTYEFAQAYSAYALEVRGGAMPGGEWAAWLGSWLWVPTTGLIPTFLFLVFPDGRLPSHRWRPVAWYGAIALTVFTVTVALLPGPLEGTPSVRNPVSPFSGEVTQSDGLVLQAMFFVSLAFSVAALVRRFRRSRGVERLQMKWITYAGGVYAVAVFADSAFRYKPFEIVDLIMVNAIPVAAGIAVLRYRLYEIDVLINRTLVYGLTSGAVGAAFFGSVLVTQGLLRPITAGSELAIAVSTLASFALYQPLRARIQRAVDRRFYRSRYDAQRTVDAFATRLRDEVDLQALRKDLLGTVLETMAPVHASLWLRERGENPLTQA